MVVIVKYNKIVLKMLVLLLLICLTEASISYNSDPWCDEEQLYQTYLKQFDSRLEAIAGKPKLIIDSGLYIPDIHLKNTHVYLCINGV